MLCSVTTCVAYFIQSTPLIANMLSPAREKSIEVTAEDAASVTSNLSPSSLLRSSSTGNSSRSVTKKLTNFAHALRSPKLNRLSSTISNSDYSTRPYYTSVEADADNNSYNSESIGQMSVAPTVASLDTVKISNRQAQILLEGGDAGGNTPQKAGKKTPWKKLKKFMGLPPGNSNKRSVGDDYTVSDDVSVGRRAHSKSVDLEASQGATEGPRRRLLSMDLPKSNNGKSQEEPASCQRKQHDDSVRGRLDGIDLLYLGPAHMISLERQTGFKSNSECSSTPWEPAPSYSFAGRSTQYCTQQMVTDMVRRSMGQECSPEIILEGFFRDDRWIVNLDMPKKSTRSLSSRVESSDVLIAVDNDNGRHSPDGLPPLQLTDEEEHSHSTAPDEVPRHKLWGSMWGSESKPPPKPSHMTSVEDVDPDADSILEMAALCSVPIDVDEDTFMISNAQHLQAVHDLASVPLQHGHFGEAMEIFKRILRGIEIQESDALRHLEGVTLHNMSIISMWQEDYGQALDFAGKAIKARLQYLPEGHPDIAVSLVRQGYAYFALERYDMAEASFHAALEKLTEENVVKAKVLLNLGVARYQRGDDIAALKNFTDALEIQRVWLQGPVRREATVFGAAVMLGNMGKIHIKRGDYDLAVSVYEEALLLLTSMFRADHDLVLANLISLSLAWAFNSLPLKAGQILNGVLRSQLSRMGPATVPVVETTGAIGNLHFGLGNYEDALKCFTPVLKWQKANLQSEHPALQKTKDIMKKIKKSIKAVWV